MEYLIITLILFSGIFVVRSAGPSNKTVSLVEIKKQNQDASKQEDLIRHNETKDSTFEEIINESIKKPPVKIGGEDAPDIFSRAAIILDMETGAEIFQKNSNVQLPIASITKIITALVAYEKADFTKEITISREAVETEGSAGDLIIGENFKMADLLRLMLLTSSNDAAIQVGMEIAENLNDFTILMNEKAKDYELKQSVFVEPSGVDEGNLSSAREIAQLSLKTFLNNSPIWGILKNETLEIASLDGNKHFLENTNELISDKFVFSGKTGYTSKARGTLAIIADSGQNDRKIVAVILGSEDRFGDMDKLLKWVRRNFQFPILNSY